MTLKIGPKTSTLLHKVEEGVKSFKADADRNNDQIRADAQLNPGTDGWLQGLARDVSGGVANGLAEMVGLAELAGFRYEVKPYQFQVSATLSRGTRIDTPAGYQKLKEQGFRSVVDLTLEGTKDAQLAPAAGLHVENVKVLDNASPSNEQMKQLLDFVTDPANQPAYIHCEAGKGRTGVATAVYRMAVEGWPLETALSEARHFGLALPYQEEFIARFAADLKAGKIDGYPKAAP